MQSLPTHLRPFRVIKVYKSLGLFSFKIIVQHHITGKSYLRKNVRVFAEGRGRKK